MLQYESAKRLINKSRKAVIERRAKMAQFGSIGVLDGDAFSVITKKCGEIIRCN